MHTDNADMLYNKFNVGYRRSGPSVPVNPPRYPNHGDYNCAIARTDWKVVRCSSVQHVVCQEGLFDIVENGGDSWKPETEVEIWQSEVIIKYSIVTLSSK